MRVQPRLNIPTGSNQNEFRLLPPIRYTPPHHPLTTYKKPTHITSFSYSPSRQLLTGGGLGGGGGGGNSRDRDLALKYFAEPLLESDLNYGFDQCVWRDEGLDEGLDSLLDTLGESLSSNNNNNNKPGRMHELLDQTRLITWRGMLTKLLTAVYDVEAVSPQAAVRQRSLIEGWEMNAMVIDGTLYLEEFVSDETRIEKGQPDPQSKKFMYYGYAFESYCTTSFPSDNPGSSNPPVPLEETPDRDIETGWSGTVNTNVQWCSIVSTKLGNDIPTILGGEVDCLANRGKGDLKKNSDRIETDDFIELKICGELDHERARITFERFKMLRFYTQSFLIGLPSIYVGFRSREGKLKSTSLLKVPEIPESIRTKPHAWEPTALLSAGYDIISFIRDRVASSSSTSSFESSLSTNAIPGSNYRFDNWVAWPVFRVSFDPRLATVSMRELTRVEVENQVLKAKSHPEQRVGFLNDRWMQTIWERKRARVAAATRQTGGQSSKYVASPSLARQVHSSTAQDSFAYSRGIRSFSGR